MSAGARIASPRLAVVLPACLALIVCSPTLLGDFVYDDDRQILGNPLLYDLSRLPALWISVVWAGAGSSSSFYRPLMMSSFAIDRALFGWTPLFWHLTQLLLWGGAVALAARLVQQTHGRAALTLAAASIFAVHPLLAEPVAWLSGRGDLLLAALGFAALLAHRREAFASAGCLFLFALTAKESAVVLLPAFAILDRIAGRAFHPRSLASRYTWIALASLVYGGARWMALGEPLGGVGGGLDPSLLAGGLGSAWIRFFVPLGLTVTPTPPGLTESLLGGVTLVALLGLGAVGWRDREPWLLPLGLGVTAWVVAALAGARIGVLSDRYLVIPVLCAAWGAALLADRALPRRTGWRGAVCTIALLPLAGLSFRHALVFRSDESLWTHVFAHNPNSVTATINLAVLRLEAGDPAGARRWLDRAQRLEPGSHDVTLNRAVLAEAIGDPAEARRLLEGIVRESPRHWPAQLRLGHLALERLDLDEAVTRYQSVLAVYELAAEAWAGLGVARWHLRDEAGARIALARALEIDPRVQNADELRRMLAELRAPREDSP